MTGIMLSLLGRASTVTNVSVDYLVVAGGGSGACGGAGGAGAGGLLSGTLTALLSTAYTLTIGAGGAGVTNNALAGNNGSASTFSTISPTGGGGGGCVSVSSGNGKNGGSGGGAWNTGTGGTGISGQGFAGGGGGGSDTFGGGGAGAAATTVDGANGVVNSITGTQTSSSSVAIGTGSKTFTVASGLSYSAGQPIRVQYDASNYMDGRVTSYSSTSLVVDVRKTLGSGTYSSWSIDYMYAGGGGGQVNVSTVGKGGSGGGGNGGNNANGEAGVANFGGGSGGNGGTGVTTSQNGGSGVVILKIPDTRSATFSGGVTQTLVTTGGYKIYRITAAGVSDTVTFS